MARKRRPFEVFSMSFLDCMSCGFGAVILFFMIINAQVRETTETDPSDLMAETRKLEVEILDGRKNLVLATNTVEELKVEQDTAEGQIAQIIALIEELRAELAEYDLETLAVIERVEQLQTDIKTLATAGVTLGCYPPTNDRYCPSEAVTRAQMAAFLHRAMGD